MGFDFSISNNSPILDNYLQVMSSSSVRPAVPSKRSMCKINVKNCESHSQGSYATIGDHDYTGCLEGPTQCHQMMLSGSTPPFSSDYHLMVCAGILAEALGVRPYITAQVTTL